MSWEPLICSKCEIEAEFEQVGQLSPPHDFGVAWRCGSCGARLLDVVPVGVDFPIPGGCLNCGATLDAAGSCGACGLARPPLVAAIHELCGDPPAIAAAEQLADRGLFRLALNAVDLRLESCPDEPAAWRAKARLLARVGLGARGVVLLERALSEDPEDLQARLDLYAQLVGQRRFEQALVELDRALPRLDPELRVRLLPARAELLCELLRDAEALATIDEAIVHMPDDPGAIYTRGRALALLGDLVEARHAMARVLELEPDNSGAARALAQIDAALSGA